MMEFEEGFAVFLHESGIIKFGDYTLTSGKKSPYYIDLRQVPGHPHEFRRLIGRMREMVADGGRADSISSVPTGGTIIASALAYECVMPLVYVRPEPKGYGTSKRVEGVVRSGTVSVMVDDVSTTGGSMVDAIGALKDEGIAIHDAYVVVDRKEGAAEALEKLGVKLHPVLDVKQIARILEGRGLIKPGII